jgi:sugar O-acyltransferase (sialic acid O-acetyltransferase NeuD family)
MKSSDATNLHILGASGHGKVIADIAELLGYSVCFYDDEYPKKTTLECWPVVGTSEDMLSLERGALVFVAIGDNQIRSDRLLKLLNKGLKSPILIHPKAYVSTRALLGEGTVVAANAVINAFTHIEVGVIINSGAIVEHDCHIKSFAHICPASSLAGTVTVGAKSWIGLGSKINQQLKIGENSLIGSGSTVVRELPDNIVAYGSPATIKKVKF